MFNFLHLNRIDQRNPCITCHIYFLPRCCYKLSWNNILWELSWLIYWTESNRVSVYVPRIEAAVYNLQKVVKRVSSPHLDAVTVATWWSHLFSLVKCSSLPGHVWFASALRSLCPRYAAADTLDFQPKMVRSELFFPRLPVEQTTNQARRLASQSDRREACEFLCRFVVLYSPED